LSFILLALLFSQGQQVQDEEDDESEQEEQDEDDDCELDSEDEEDNKINEDIKNMNDFDDDQFNNMKEDPLATSGSVIGIDHSIDTYRMDEYDYMEEIN
jgi:hypothetical protein